MKRTCIKAGLAAAALGGLLGGCATTVEMGPGYYHYDTHALSSSEPARHEPKVAYAAPAVQPAPVIVHQAPVTAGPVEVAPAPGAPAQ